MANREILMNPLQIEEANSLLKRYNIDYNTFSLNKDIVPRKIFKSYCGEHIIYGSKPEIVIFPNKIDLLDDKNYTETFFRHVNFEIVEPLQIINKNKNKTTDFIGAGIFLIEDYIHSKSRINPPKRKIFVAQPSFRTQYVGQKIEGFSPTFINLASIGINIEFEEHLKIISSWENFLIKLGIEKQDIRYQENWVKKKWGETEIIGHEVYFCHRSFPLGDASFNIVINGENNGFTFSDTGFGLERTKWLLNGGKYTQNFSSKRKDYELDYCDICNIYALILLIGEGIEPGGNNYRAKIRKILKDIKINDLEKLKTITDDFYKTLVGWVELTLNQEKIFRSLSKEISNILLKNNSF